MVLSGEHTPESSTTITLVSRASCERPSAGDQWPVEPAISSETIVVDHHTAADHHVLLMVVEVVRRRCSARVDTTAAVACARAP